MTRSSSILACVLLLLAPAILAAPERNILELAYEVRPEALHAELHNYQEKFKHGVFPTDLNALEAIHREQAADATRLVQLAKRQGNSNNETSTDETSSTTTTTTVQTASTLTTTTKESTTTEGPNPTDDGPSNTAESTTTSVPETTDQPNSTTTAPTNTTGNSTSTTSTRTSTDTDESTTTTKRTKSTSFSTSRRTTTIDGKPSTVVSVVTVTPTATLPGDSIDSTATDADEGALQTGAAMDISVQVHNIIVGVGAVIAGAYFL